MYNVVNLQPLLKASKIKSVKSNRICVLEYLVFILY